MRRLFVALPICFVLASSLTAASCDTSGGSPAGSNGASGGSVATVAKGQAMKTDDGQQVTVVTVTKGVTDPNAFETMPAGKQCVKVSVSIVNGSSNEWSYPLSEMTMVDSSGQKYDASNGLGTCPSGSDSVSSLVAGGHASADLVFLVPASGALNFNWTPTLSGHVYQTAV